MTEQTTSKAPATGRRASARKAAAPAPAVTPAPAVDAEKAADLAVLAGVTTDTPAKAPARKAAPAKAAAGKAPAKGTGKPAPAPAKAAANGATVRDHKTELARKLALVLDRAFADATPEDKERVAYWCRMPTGWDEGDPTRIWWRCVNIPRPGTGYYAQTRQAPAKA